MPPRTIEIDGLNLFHFTMPNGVMTTIKDMKNSLENITSVGFAMVSKYKSRLIEVVLHGKKVLREQSNTGSIFWDAVEIWRELRKIPKIIKQYW